MNVERLLDGLARSGVPGVGAMVLSASAPPVIAVRGVRRAGGDVAVTVDDPWHLGSCTKAMTATLLARLQARGVVDFGAPLADCLPEVRMSAGFAATPLRDVLSHMAGVRRDPHWNVFRQLRGSRASVVGQRRFLAAHALGEVPGGPEYSNLGYIVLGAVVERVLGMSWERAMRREVFEPLGMVGAGFGPPQGAAPLGHRVVDGRWEAQEVGPLADNPRVYGPAGRVHMPLADWARFLRVHMGEGPKGFLPEALLAALHQPRTNGYAAGWGLSDAGRVLQHTGSNTLWFADVRLLPETGSGVVVVCNGFGSKTIK